MKQSIWIMFRDGSFRYLRTDSRRLNWNMSTDTFVMYRDRVTSITYEAVYYGETKAQCYHSQLIDAA